MPGGKRSRWLVDRVFHRLRQGCAGIFDELAQARRTIEELEAELAAVKAASALLNGEEPVNPKGGAGLPRQ